MIAFLMICRSLWAFIISWMIVDIWYTVKELERRL